VKPPHSLGSRRLPLGELLVRMGRISQAELDAALAFKHERGVKLGQALVELHLVSQADLAEALRSQGAVHCIQLTHEIVDTQVAHELGQDASRRFQAIAINRIAGIVTLAIEDPSETYHIEAIGAALNAPVFAVHAEPDRIRACLDHVFGRARSAAPPAGTRSAATAQALELASEQEAQREALDAAAADFVKSLLEGAVDARASDVHVEPHREGLRVRLRVEGTLRDGPSAPRAWSGAVLARLKLLAGLDPALCQMPQEGRTQAEVRGQRLDLLVATSPLLHGESAVVRLLDRARRRVEFDDLPLDARQRAELVELTAAGGLVVAAGPMGHGRTSTLYALLRRFDARRHKLVTVEDPVEDQLEGALQLNLNPRLGLDYERALRSVLHQDPDVLLIGELRERGPGELALQAALAGKLVLTTLHGHGGVEALTRLVDLGLEPYLLADGLRGVVAQRLVRRLCPGCRREARPSAEHALRLGLEAASFRCFEPVGCERCSLTGFQGRLALFEVLALGEALWDAVRQCAPTARLRELARAQGTLSLRQDGLAKAAQGETTLDEVFAATTRG